MNGNLARMVRDFNGLGVCRFPFESLAPNYGVYALYCTADKGIYGRYGQSVNNCRYQVPIYVGCTTKSSAHQSDAFAVQSLCEQIDFWQNAIRHSIDLDLCDFGFRWHEFAEQEVNTKLAKTLRRFFRPIWNEVFDDALSQAELFATWAEYHDMRFRSRCHIHEVECRRTTLQTLLRKVG